MPLTINTNMAASQAAFYLSKNNDNLQASLNRLSSGKRITNSSDDAGGLAVSMKLEGSIDRLKGASNNVSNAISFLQVQDGILEAAGNIVSRMGELKGLYADVLKSSSDKATYDAEFSDLQEQLYQLALTKFNGVDLFDADGSTGFGAAVQEKKDVYITEDGSSGSSVEIHQSALLGALSVNYRPETNAGALAAASAATNVLGDPTTPDAQIWSNITNVDTNGGLENYITEATGANTWTPGAAAYADGDGISFTLAVDSGGTKMGLEDMTTDGFTLALANIATLRANNGGQVSRLQFAQENLTSQATNMQAAAGRIMDVDVAEETANLAKQQILVQASASMVAQANTANNVALMLLQ